MRVQGVIEEEVHRGLLKRLQLQILYNCLLGQIRSTIDVIVEETLMRTFINAAYDQLCEMATYQDQRPSQSQSKKLMYFILLLCIELGILDCSTRIGPLNSQFVQVKIRYFINPFICKFTSSVHLIRQLSKSKQMNLQANPLNYFLFILPCPT